MEGNGGFRSGPGQWQPGHVSGQQAPDANMMMQQIQQLQQTVRELQSGGGGGGFPGGAGGQSAPGGYSSGAGGPMPGTQGMSNYRTGSSGTWSSGTGEKGGMNLKTEINEEEQTVLLVSNIPPTLANPDSLFYVFEKFGTVVKVKVPHFKHPGRDCQRGQHLQHDRNVRGRNVCQDPPEQERLCDGADG